MIQTNSEPFHICDYCERLRAESDLYECHVKEYYESFTSFKDMVCEECAVNNEDPDDECVVDTRSEWETQRNKNLRIEIEYQQAVNMEAKYYDSKDAALRRYVTKKALDCYCERVESHRRMTHQQSMKFEIAEIIRKARYRN